MLQETIHRISELREKSEIYLHLDSYAEKAITQHKRKHLLESLRHEIQQVVNYAERTMKIHGIPRTELVIHSSYQVQSRGGKPWEGYISCPLSVRNKLEFFRTNDTPRTRLTYLDEFEERCSILLKKIEEGSLEEVYGVPPFEVLHQISGRYGELVPSLGIDPFESRMYKDVIHIKTEAYRPDITK